MQQLTVSDPVAVGLGHLPIDRFQSTGQIRVVPATAVTCRRPNQFATAGESCHWERKLKQLKQPVQLHHQPFESPCPRATRNAWCVDMACLCEVSRNFWWKRNENHHSLYRALFIWFQEFLINVLYPNFHPALVLKGLFIARCSYSKQRQNQSAIPGSSTWLNASHGHAMHLFWPNKSPKRLTCWRTRQAEWQTQGKGCECIVHGHTLRWSPVFLLFLRMRSSYLLEKDSIISATQWFPTVFFRMFSISQSIATGRPAIESFCTHLLRRPLWKTMRPVLNPSRWW